MVSISYCMYLFSRLFHSMSVCLSVCMSVCSLSVCLLVCLYVSIRKHSTTREPIILAGAPETDIFFFYLWTHLLPCNCQGNNSRFPVPRLAMDHQRILTWAYNILFNILRRKNIYLLKPNVFLP